MRICVLIYFIYFIYLFYLFYIYCNIIWCWRCWWSRWSITTSLCFIFTSMFSVALLACCAFLFFLPRLLARPPLAHGLFSLFCVFMLFCVCSSTWWWCFTTFTCFLCFMFFATFAAVPGARGRRPLSVLCFSPLLLFYLVVVFFRGFLFLVLLQ